MKFVYKGPFFFWLSVLIACASALVVKSKMASTTEGNELKTLEESSPHKIRHEMRKGAHELTQQSRHLVCKQIYISEGPLRRLFDIKAERSTISVISKKPHMHVVETFYNAKGYLQQELFYTDAMEPKQRYRYFEADEARYDFETHQLVASGVKFWTFVADGHEPLEHPLGDNPESVGVASKMSFYPTGPNSKEQLSAESLKLWFTPEGGI